MASLPAYIQRLQKNARNKEYRLRAKGALAIDVADLSPRLPASEVARMSKAEQRAYAARLRRFNSRDNALTVYRDTGAIVRTSVARSIERNIAEYNRHMEQRVESIRKATERIPGYEKQFGSLESVLRTQGYEASPYRFGGQYVGGRIRQIRMDAPTSAEQAERRERMLREMNRVTSDDARRRQVRRNFVDMLNMAGENALANRVRNLSNFQFDVLTTATNFCDLVTVEYAKTNPHQFDGMGESERMKALLDMATSDEGWGMDPEKAATIGDLISDVRVNVPTRPL